MSDDNDKIAELCEAMNAGDSVDTLKHYTADLEVEQANIKRSLQEQGMARPNADKAAKKYELSIEGALALLDDNAMPQEKIDDVLVAHDQEPYDRAVLDYDGVLKNLIVKERERLQSDEGMSYNKASKESRRDITQLGDDKAQEFLNLDHIPSDIKEEAYSRIGTDIKDLNNNEKIENIQGLGKALHEIIKDPKTTQARKVEKVCSDAGIELGGDGSSGHGLEGLTIQPNTRGRQ